MESYETASAGDEHWTHDLRGCHGGRLEDWKIGLDEECQVAAL